MRSPRAATRLCSYDDGEHGPHLRICASGAGRTRITSLSLSRNFGPQAALGAPRSLEPATAVVLMDGTCRLSPERAKLVAAFHEVTTSRPRFRYETERRVRARTCTNPVHRVIALSPDLAASARRRDFCLMSRRLVEQLKAGRSGIALPRVGAPGSVSANRDFRSARRTLRGESKSNFLRLFIWPSTHFSCA